jgi:aminoglycoside phosphotransferase (APT) family kinase protein
MTDPWQAERADDPGMVADLVARQFPELRPVSARLMGAGWDNSAYLINDAIVFRLPRRLAAVPCIEAEIQVMPAIADRLPLAVPRAEFVGRLPDCGWPMVGHRLVPGRTACSAPLDAQARSACAEDLARFLRALHAIDAADGRGLGAPEDTLGRLAIERRSAQIRANVAKAQGRGLIDATTAMAVLDRSLPTATAQARCVVHGDLYVRHLLVDDGLRLCGVIDWGDVHVGDPAVDLAIAYSFLPAAARPRFFSIYGACDDATRSLARFRALSHTSNTLVYAAEVADRDLLRESLIALALIAED